MPSPARPTPATPPGAEMQTPRRVTLARLGELFATPSARARYGVTVAMRGKPPGAAPRRMVFEWHGLTWHLAKGEAMPVTEQEPRGLDFRKAAVVLRFRGQRVDAVTRTGWGAFAIETGWTVAYVDEDTAIEVEGLE